MKVVDKKENGSPAIHGRRCRCADGRESARGCQLGFLTGAAGGHPIKKFNRRRFTIDAQRKVFALQTVDEASVLVEDHYVRLYEIGIDANDVFRLLRGSF